MTRHASDTERNDAAELRRWTMNEEHMGQVSEERWSNTARPLNTVTGQHGVQIHSKGEVQSFAFIADVPQDDDPPIAKDPIIACAVDQLVNDRALSNRTKRYQLSRVNDGNHQGP